MPVVTIEVDGVPAKVRVAGLSVRDNLNDTPNTCNLVIDGSESPVDGQDLRITLDTPRLLFAGTLQTVSQTYEGRPVNGAWPCRGIDYTARLNYRRPFGTWVDVSATTVATDLVTTFAPGFTTSFIEAGLPAITITCDGSEDLIGALGRIAVLIGGYTKVEDLDVYLFLEDTTDPPDDVDAAHPPLDDPPIQCSIDDSQLRTRVYGKGHAEPLLSDVLDTETILPIADDVMYGTVATGGQVIAATTPDGAASKILSYTGVQRGGVGGLVGPGASPSSALDASVVGGAGVTTGAHQYAVTFTTASGESLPSPLTTVVVGATVPSPTGPSGFGFHGGYTNLGTGGPYPFVAGDGVRKWAYTWTTATGETLPSPAYWIPGTFPLTGGPYYANLDLPVGPPGTTGRKLYRTVHGGSQLKLAVTIANNTATTVDDHITDGALGANAPTANTATVGNQVALSAIPLGPATVTARKIYRTPATNVDPTWATNANAAAVVAASSAATAFASPSYATFITARDNAAIAQMYFTGAAVTAVGGAATAASNAAMACAVAQNALTNAAANPTDAPTITAANAAVTDMNTKAATAAATFSFSTQLKLQQTIGNNTATVGVQDATPDGSLGVDVPVVDASALGQVDGQVIAGSTTIPVAGTSAFDPAGGWAIVGNGQIIIRYTGVTGTALTGIPTRGPGTLTASIAYNSTITVAPALTGVTLGGVSAPPLPFVLTNAPAVTMVTGAGMADGARNWAYTFVTVAGESQPSPVASGTAFAQTPPPAFTLTDIGFDASSNIAAGTYVYGLTYISGALETTATVSASITVAVGHRIQLNYGGVGLTGTLRKIYRTAAGGAQLKKLFDSVPNASTSGIDTNADAALGANVPTVNTLVSRQAALTAIAVGPSGTTARRLYRTVAGGSQLKLVTTIANNTATTYTDTTVDGSLGADAPTTDTSGLLIPPGPGVTLTVALQKGAPVHIWVQRDDLVAQADAAVRESTGSYTSDGIHEHLLTDARRGEASLSARCDADLALFAQPIVTYLYATRDVKTKSGKTVHINLSGYPVGDYVIQDVTIDQIDIATGLAPRFLVKASNVAFSLEDMLRRLAQLAPV